MVRLRSRPVVAAATFSALWGASVASQVTTLLETDLADAGFDAERVADRLANFLSVQNTYLSTFQTLGGLGLLLGTVGLGVVMMAS